MKTFPRDSSLQFAFSAALVLITTATTAVSSERWAGTCRVEFSGTSTLGAWSGEVDTQPFVVVVGNADELATSSLATVISARTDDLSTDSERRDKAIKEAMKAELFPNISVELAPDFSMARTRPVVKNGVLQPTVMPFIVTLLGERYEMVAQVAKCQVGDGVMRLELKFPVSLEACGVDAPSFLGIIRVGDTVEISAFVTLRTGSAVVSR